MASSEDLAAWLRREIEGDLGRARHILDVRGARPEPRLEMHDAIADCEAKLAVLDFHDLAETWEQATGKPLKQAEVLRIVVRQVGHGYRYRDGYRAEWKP